jgi:hypothetical protein
MRFVFLFVFLSASEVSFSQSITQTLRGSVIDRDVQQSLIGANVIVLNTQPLLGATSNEDGNFRIDHIPVGTYNIQVTYIGYEPQVIPNVELKSGKETVITIRMAEKIIQGEEVVVTADQRKDQPLNEMSTVSTRTFSVEETQRYAAAINDPGRMVISYPGVVSADDGNNTISIRGNSPNGLLWRMEGIEIPNPNHFSSVGSSGGGISILNAQILSNSDFITGAFAAEYGDAVSGVFDLRLRKGNNEKMEFTGQAGFLGLSVAAEGPFSKNYKGSYLVNYRYSTLSILTGLGVLGDDNVTNFQDLSYHVFLPTRKAGYFSLFGFGGLSNQKYPVINDSLKWENYYDRYGGEFFANTGVAGFTHSYLFGSKAYLKTGLAISSTGNGEDDVFTDDDYEPVITYHASYRQQKQTLSSVLTWKLSTRMTLRSGIITSRWQYNLMNQNAENPESPLITYIDEKGNTFISQAFSQAQFRISEKTTLNGGLHYQILWLNNTQAIEPRLALEHHINDRQTVAFAYGLHSQAQPIGIYFIEVENANGGITMPNHDLGFTKAHHFVASYSYLFTPALRVKTELYYQALFDIPVSKDSGTSFSMVNSYGDFVTEPLVNNGTGKNYGLELTVEKFLAQRYYFLISTSLFQSKYKGSDGIERNTRWNSNYNFVVTGGKEFVLSKESDHTLLGFNMKVIYTGGFRTTPIDLSASMAAGETVLENENAFSDQNPSYFRLDAGVSLKLNRRKLTSTFLLDIQNATNNQNVFGQYFEPAQNKIVTYYSTPFIPVLSYRVEF